MHVQNPTCSQLWSYHAYLNVVVSQLYLKTMLLNARLDKTVSTEETKELVFETLSLVNILGDLTSAAPPDQMIKNFFAATKMETFLIPEDHALAKKLIGATIDMAHEAIKHGGKLAANTSPGVGFYVELAEIFANLAWISFYNSITQSFNELIIADEYLRHFYKYGKDRQSVISGYGLKPGSSNKDLYAVIAAKLGLKKRLFTGSPYHIGKISNIINTLVSSEVSAVAFCKANNCGALVNTADATQMPEPGMQASTAAQKPANKTGATSGAGSGLSIVPSPAKSMPPVARIVKVSPASPQQGDQVVFDSATSTDDKDSSGGLLVRWDFDGDGAFETNWVYQKIAKWAYTSPGRYTVRLDVRDSDWNISSATNQIDIASRQVAPVQPSPRAPTVANSSASSGNVTGISSTTMNGVIIGPVNYLQNTQVMGMSMGCGIRARVRNTTGQIKSLALVFNAFDSVGNGVGTAMIQGLLTAQTTQDMEAFWMDLGGGQVNCQQIKSFRLDANSMVP